MQQAPAAAGDDGSSSCKRARTTTVAPHHQLQVQQQQLPPPLRGRYELLSVRGKGASAEVWEARHLRTGLKVAIKILRHHHSDDDASSSCCRRKKVEREVVVMRLLRHHPHIIRLLEAAFTNDHAFIVMELAEWGQLYDHVVTQAGGRLPEAEARRMFRQLVSAVLYCHRSLVVHRDLKMENVLLTSQGDVKLIDFGFSKLLPSHSAPMRRKKGSPHYAAPELHGSARSSYTGPQVDVWSCGIILYAMLCGFLPFDCDDIDMGQLNKLKRIIRRGDSRPLPAWVSDDARDIIAGMLIVRPQKRMTMAEVWEHRWLQPQPQLQQQPALPSEMMMPPASCYLHLSLMEEINGAAVEQLVTRHGFDRSSLLESLGKGIEDEAAVAYHLLVLSSRRRHRNEDDASSPPPPPAVATTSSRLHVARVLREMGIRILFSYRHGHRHGMVCCAPPAPAAAPVVVPTTIVRSSSASAAPDAAYSLISHDDQLQMDNDHDILDTLSAAVFFEIQLYKQQAAEEGNNPNNHSHQQQQYEVHLKRTSGPQPPYLRICSQIASKLRRPQAV
ncbi:hypothetical protein U9M48_030189 [Paspalum notatum var. saurae]|uniref:Uncharacterized protein n=1 Tax=Paspalum notatum var. saurae TaxID=547442 RepID=A0AAQ3U0B3_PASNO